MLVLTIHSRYRNRRAGVGLDTVTETSGLRRDRRWTRCRCNSRGRESVSLLPRSLRLRYMWGNIIALRAIAHEMVEECRNGGTIWRIVTRKSGRMVSSLPSISLAIWLMIPLSLVSLSVVLTLTSSIVRNPYHSIFIHFATFACCALFLFVLGLVFFGEGTTGPDQCSAGTYIRSGEGARGLEINYASRNLGIEEEGLSEAIDKNRKFTNMSESHTLLNDLLARVQGIEFISMCEKLKAIVACADLYIEAMNSNPQDESLAHLAEIRREALTLLEECGKFPPRELEMSKQEEVRDRYGSLCALVEFAYVLRNPQRVEDVHAAL